MRAEVCVKRIFTSLYKNLDVNSKNYTFIKYNFDIRMSYEKIKAIIPDDVKILFCNFTMNEMQGAFSPFLEWIRSIYYESFSETMTIREFLEKAEVYEPQIQMLIKYMETGRAYRSEDLIISEVEYEKNKLLNSILNMIVFISENVKLMLVMCNLNYAGNSTVDLINALISKYVGKRIAIAASFSSNIYDYSTNKSFWNNLMEKIKDENILIEIDEEVDEDFFENILIKDIDRRKVFESKIDGIIDKLSNMTTFMAYYQAEYYFNVYDEIKDEIELTEEEQYCINKMHIFNCLFIDNIDQAIELCNTLLENEDLIDAGIKKYEINYLASIVYIHDQNSMAVEYARKCKEIALLINYEIYAQKAEILYYTAISLGWKNRIFSKPLLNVMLTEDSEIINIVKKLDFKNTLAYLYLYYFDNDKETMDYNAETMMVNGYLKKSIELAESIGNANFVITAYLRKIFDYYSLGSQKYDSYIQYLHNARFEILDSSESFSYDEYKYDYLGYACMTNEKYQQANDYFNKYLEYGYENNDMAVITDGFYNLGHNAICSSDYRTGIKYIASALKVIDLVGISEKCACGLAKLYGLAALCYFYLDEDYNCNIYVTKIDRMTAHFANSEDENDFFCWDDELFLLNLVRALQFSKRGNAVAAQISFSRANIHLKRTNGYQFFALPIYTFEQAKLYWKMGENKKKDEVLLSGIEFCEANGYELNEARLRYFYENDEVIEIDSNVEYHTDNINRIFEKVRLESLEQKYLSRYSDILFLNNWQKKIRSQNMSEKTVVNKAMRLIQIKYKFDEMYLMSIEDDNPRLIYSVNDIEDTSKTIGKIYEFFKVSNNVFQANRYDNLFYEFKSVIDLFNIENILDFVGIPILHNDKIIAIFIGYSNVTKARYKRQEMLTDSKDVENIKFVLMQLFVVLDKMKARVEIDNINMKLYNMAVTDLLTGINNRQGFEKMLTEQFQGETLYTSIFYIDLDNFKVYNDLYGHEFGDVLLKMFANLIVETLEKGDTAVRYGGDEFLIFSTKKRDEDVIKKLAETLIYELERKQLEILKNNNKDISMVKDKKLMCSIGIASGNCSIKEDVVKLINKADDELFRVKKNNKGWYSFCD